MYVMVSVTLLITLSLAMARALLGPTVYDRLLALNMFGTKAVLLIATLGYLSGRPEFLDISLVYALINFISVIAVTRFVKYRSMGVSRQANDQGDL